MLVCVCEFFASSLFTLLHGMQFSVHALSDSVKTPYTPINTVHAVLGGGIGGLCRHPSRHAQSQSTIGMSKT